MTEASGLRPALPLIAAGFVISFIVVGGGIDTVGVFLNALAAATEWSRSGLSLGVSVGAVCAALSTPLVGAAVDRYGVRVPMLAGVVLLALGFVILLSMSEAWHFVVANVLLGPGFAACAMLPITIAIAVQVPERTALALGIVATGSSAGALLLAPALQAVIDALGWRGTYAVLGTAVVLTPLPLIGWAIPAGRLRRSSGARLQALGASRLVDDLRRPGVAALATIMVLPGFAAFSVSVHLMPLLTSFGYAAAVAAATLGATIGMSAVGKISGGLLGDRYGVLPTLRLAMLLWSGALLLLHQAGTVAVLSAFVVLYGLALGAHIAVVPAIAAGVLAPERFGALFGVLQLAAMLAAALGPLVSGLLFDATGGYGVAIVLWLAALGVATVTACLMSAPAVVPAVALPESS